MMFKGSWYIKDSIFFFENIPKSKTYIDSIFVVNDQWKFFNRSSKWRSKNCFNSKMEY